MKFERSSVVECTKPYSVAEKVETGPDAEGLREAVYTPNSSLRSPGVMFREMFSDLERSRELAWRLFIRDVCAQHRQSLLGYFWVLAPPITSALLFVFLQSQRILNIQEADVPYAVYVFTGLVLWQTFTASLKSPIDTVGGAVSMLTRLNFPRTALILKGVYQVFFDLSIRLLLLAGVFAWFGITPTWTLCLAPLGVLFLIVLGFVLGLLLVPLGLLYQDVGRGLGMFLTAWMLITPVIYPPPTSWPASLVVQINPVSSLLVTTRQMAIGSELTCVLPFLAISLASILLVLPAWVLYHLAMPHLIARMSA